jgi:CubicO group peptidase (beta-lactamase class C family)
MKNRSVVILTIVSVIVLSGCLAGKISHDNWVSYSSPTESGLNPDSLRKIDSFIATMIDAGKIPGAAVLVARNGKIVYHKAIGYQDKEQGTPLDTNDIFRIASMTKPVVSVAIMQLYENGKLNLSDPVSKYIPSFGQPKVLETFNAADTSWTSTPAAGEVTIHHLLTHTSGVGYSFSSRSLSPIYSKNGIPDLANARNITIEEVTGRLGKLPLMFEPGTKYMYGLSIDVLGRVVEVASGMTLGEYVEQNITGPLKMNDTKFFFRDDVSSRLATVYVYNPREKKIVTTKTDAGSSSSDYPVEGAMRYFSGGSGLSSTPRDYFIFAQAILNGGEYNGVRILSEESVTMMTSDQLGKLRWSEVSTFGYGFTVERMRNADNSPGTVVNLGWAGAFNTWFTINPTDKIVAVIMSQVLFNPYEQELIGNFRKAISASTEK